MIRLKESNEVIVWPEESQGVCTTHVLVKSQKRERVEQGRITKRGSINLSNKGMVEVQKEGINRVIPDETEGIKFNYGLDGMEGRKT